MALSTDELTYLLEEAKQMVATDLCRKKYGSEVGIALENEWEAKLDRGRWAIYDKARRKYLRYSSLEESDIHAAIETIRRTISK